MFKFNTILKASYTLGLLPNEQPASVMTLDSRKRVYVHNTKRQVVKHEVCLQILIQTTVASLVMCGPFMNHFSFFRSCRVVTTKHTKQLQSVDGNDHFYLCGIIIHVDWKLGLMGEHIDQARILFKSLRQKLQPTHTTVLSHSYVQKFLSCCSQ